MKLEKNSLKGVKHYVSETLWLKFQNQVPVKQRNQVTSVFERNQDRMRANKELKAAYGITIVLLVVGILSFTAFSAKPPDQPVRIMLKSAGGKVLFDHKTHTSESGYAVKCFDCHHHPPEDDAAIRSCGDCHSQSEETKKETSSCRDCHDEGELETEETMKRSDAFHKQCIDCHKENDAGPKECAACHVL
jgi:uncharacterized paraquat-inducible protein A